MQTPTDMKKKADWPDCELAACRNKRSMSHQSVSARMETPDTAAMIMQISGGGRAGLGTQILHAAIGRVPEGRSLGEGASCKRANGEMRRGTKQFTQSMHTPRRTQHNPVEG